MALYQDYITESEAIHITGISAATLNRFAKAGYLQVEPDNDGLIFYSRSELEKLFGVSFDEDSKESTDTKEVDTPQDTVGAKAPESSTIESEITENFEPEESDSLYSSPSHSSVTSAQQSTTNRIIEDSIVHLRREKNAPATFYSTPLYQERQAHTEVKNSTVRPKEDKIKVATLARAQEQELSNDTLSAEQREIVKLKNIIRLQEQILDLKDNEIADLQGQRKWLQARIEKLEEKYDRSQILLLSETQTMNKLISLHYEKKGPFRAAIEWVGELFTPPALPAPQNNRSQQNQAQSNQRQRNQTQRNQAQPKNQTQQSQKSQQSSKVSPTSSSTVKLNPNKKTANS